MTSTQNAVASLVALVALATFAVVLSMRISELSDVVFDTMPIKRPTPTPITHRDIAFITGEETPFGSFIVRDLCVRHYAFTIGPSGQQMSSDTFDVPVASMSGQGGSFWKVHAVPVEPVCGGPR